MPRVGWTSRAEHDLIEIWGFVARDDPAAADRLLDSIDRHARQLAVFPSSGMARPDIAPGIRHLVVGGYLILYRLTADGSEIVPVMHGRRKLGRSVLD